jgi:hypothetical protein
LDLTLDTQVPSPDPQNLHQLEERTKESIEKVRHLVDEMKIVQEYENTILGEDEPPLFYPERPEGLSPR